MRLRKEISDCRLCAERFQATHSRHDPRPVVWFQSDARILVAGQAPGARVHQSGKPFTDPSGDRLRAWMGLDDTVFYNKKQIAILPMAFCFPGYNAKGADLPPPPICARTWRDRAGGELPNVRLTLLIGGYSQKWHLGPGTVTDRVRHWRDHAPAVFPLPHPSWRNTAWLKKNPWFEAELVPALRHAVEKALT